MIRQILSRWLNKRRKIWRTYKKFSRNKSKNVYIRNRRKSLMQKTKEQKVLMKMLLMMNYDLKITKMFYFRKNI